jgi:5-(carboxyamino)imidazole ribonucleotide synthase
MKLLPPRVGILGAGQLGCMLAESLFRYGCEVKFFDENPNAPGKLRTPFFACGAWTDQSKLKSFFESCDVVTYEFENIDPLYLSKISSESNTPLFPSAKVLETTQSRDREKSFAAFSGLPCTPHLVLNAADDLKGFCDHFTPSIAKTLRGGYDGKSQWQVRTAEELLAIASHLPLILEAPLKLSAEASVIVARNAKGDTSLLGPFDNFHTHHRLSHTFFPSVLSVTMQSEMMKIALEAAEKLDIVGLLTTEFFVCSEQSNWKPSSPALGQLKSVDGCYLGINEFAPRSHNSGHVSRLALDFSQYDLQAMALLGIPFPKQNNPRKTGTFAMYNIYGEDIIAAQNKPKKIALDFDTHYPSEFCLYGKTEAREGRKMGHFSVHLGTSAFDTHSLSKQAEWAAHELCASLSTIQKTPFRLSE